MKGNSTFIFNTATMIEIVQHYFNTVLFKEKTIGKVVNFKKTSQGSVIEKFEIEVDGIQEENNNGEI